MFDAYASGSECGIEHLQPWKRNQNMRPDEKP
jgi:hypothetical protein